MTPQPLSVAPEDLRPNPWNTNVLSPDAENKLDQAIRRFGFFKPIVVRETDTGFEIIGGEHRWESSKRLKYTTVPIMNLGRIDDKTAKEISLADNARYGIDDTVSLAELINEIGTPEDLQNFLPYTDEELASIFSSVSVSLDEIDLNESEPETELADEPALPKAAKTHTVMRFKVAITDAEKITDLIVRTQKRQGLTLADELTNAGDALVHLLLGAKSEETEGEDDE